MARRRKKFHPEFESTFELMLASMVDMFTVILIFLISSFTMSSVQVNLADKLRLPASETAAQPKEGLKLVVSKSGIFVEDKQIVIFAEGQLAKQDLDPGDSQFIKPLFDELNRQADKSKNIAAQNETVKFTGEVVMQADEGMSYGLLKKVMYTATLAGYADLKMAAVMP